MRFQPTAATLAPTALARHPHGIYDRPRVMNRGHHMATASAQGGGSHTSATYRSVHKILRDCTDFSLVYDNDSALAHDGNPNAITVKCSIAPASGTYPSLTVGTIEALRFEPSCGRAVTLEGGARARTIPFGGVLRAGTYIYVHSNVTVAGAGLLWPVRTLIGDLATTGMVYDQDYTLSGTIPQVSGNAYGPSAGIGRPVGGGNVIDMAIVGDSVFDGQGNNYNGFGMIACDAANYGWTAVAYPGDRAGAFATLASNRLRMEQIAGCSHAIVNYGINDIGNGSTLAVLQADTIAVWRNLAATGMQVGQCTILPNTTSTSGNYTSDADQTPAAGCGPTGVRTNYNDWLRDGAPMTALFVAVATGTATAGTIRIGAPTHPLERYYEAADAVETGRNTGFWKSSPTNMVIPNGGGPHPGSNGHTAAAATITASWAARPLTLATTA